MRLVALLGFGLFVACGGSPAPAPAPAPSIAPPPIAPEARMDTFTLSGYLLAGAEYWPYVGSAEIAYPEEVLWGFYPEAGVVPPGETDPNPATARPEAIACARTAYDALRAFLAADPPALRRVLELASLRGDVVPRFYLWTNDYGRADDPYPPGMREARLWYWRRKEPAPPKPPGYWKWESRLTQRGECEIPPAAQIERYLAEMALELEARERPAAR